MVISSPSNVPWAVEMVSTPRHPLPLYEAASSLIILGILMISRQRKPWSGFHFCLFVLLYSSAHLFLEIFRAHPAVIGNGYLAGQVVALGAIVVSLAVMAYNFSNTTTQTQVEKHEMV